MPPLRGRTDSDLASPAFSTTDDDYSPKTSPKGEELVSIADDNDNNANDNNDNINHKNSDSNNNSNNNNDDEDDDEETINNGHNNSNSNSNNSNGNNGINSSQHNGNDDGKGYAFQLTVGGSVTILRARSDAERSQWISAIGRGGKD